MINHHCCAWAEGDALLRACHDEEWGVPKRDSRMRWAADPEPILSEQRAQSARGLDPD